MANTEINNEVILLRHVVRQARVCTVNKLIREAKLLQNKHGNEIQKEKYKRRANRLIDEIHVLKTIKDDDISKFGITNENSLNNILQDQCASKSNRITARVTYYKPLYRRLMQFREKFPDYKKYFIKEKRKKTTKTKAKNVTKVVGSLKEDDPHTEYKSCFKEQKFNPDKSIECFQCPQDAEMREPEKSATRNSSRECKQHVEKRTLTKLQGDNTCNNIIVHNRSNKIKSPGITKEATIKRFTELLKDEGSKDTQTCVESTDSINIATVQEETVDDFFVTGNDRNRQENCTTTTSSFNRDNTRTKTFHSNNRIQEHDLKYKNNRSFNKTKEYSEVKNKLEPKNIERNNKRSYLVKQEKNTFSKIHLANNKITVANNNLVNTSNKGNDVLHPSWAAKRKQQEILNQGFQGKRTIFTDDG